MTFRVFSTPFYDDTRLRSSVLFICYQRRSIFHFLSNKETESKPVSEVPMSLRREVLRTSTFSLVRCPYRGCLREDMPLLFYSFHTLKSKRRRNHIRPMPCSYQSASLQRKWRNPASLSLPSVAFSAICSTFF